VEFGALVTLWSAHRILGLPSAELAKVLRCSGDYVLEQLKGDSTQRLSCFELDQYKVIKSAQYNLRRVGGFVRFRSRDVL
jgi:hypothetical protein